MKNTIDGGCVVNIVLNFKFVVVEFDLMTVKLN